VSRPRQASDSAKTDGSHTGGLLAKRERFPATLTVAAAFCVAGVIAAFTFGPMSQRPVTSLGSDLERAGAFMLLGVLSGIAWPNQRRVAWALVILALSSELLQFVTPDRGARWTDAAIKSLGAMTGLFAGRTISLLARRGSSDR